MLELPPSATLDRSSNRPLYPLSVPHCELSRHRFAGRQNATPAHSDEPGRRHRMCLARNPFGVFMGGPHTRIVQRCQGLLTLFSKGFSSFVCTTCLLSVSVQYLAFAGVHLRICAALSNCTTLRDNKRVGNGAWDIRDDRPLWWTFLGSLYPTAKACKLSFALQFHGFRFHPPRIQA